MPPFGFFTRQDAVPTSTLTLPTEGPGREFHIPSCSGARAGCQGPARSRARSARRFTLAFSFLLFSALPVCAELPPQTYAPVVKRIAPAVVNIYAKHVVHEQVSPFFNDPLFRQFFGGQIPGI